MSTKMIIGDCRDKLRELPADSVHCVVTSPPYWGLRDYGVKGQIGLEPTLAEHLAVIVDVFREVRRIMRPDATLWLNYGDCYNNFRSSMGTGQGLHGRSELRGKPAPASRSRGDAALKEKDLCMVANRLAIALQEDGWWVRSEIIWHKPNPMPESVTDRPTSSHEKLWLLSKSARYHYDHAAVLEPFADERMGNPGAYKRTANEGKDAGNSRGDKSFLGEGGGWNRGADIGRNLRNVWTIPSAPFAKAHFATFPPALVEPCIKAGCPVGGTVLDPFGGSGTVGLVADRLGRDAILIDLNPNYDEMARERITADGPLFTQII